MGHTKKIYIYEVHRHHFDRARPQDVHQTFEYGSTTCHTKVRLTPPRPLRKVTRSPPKATTRAPLLQYDICVSFRKQKERVNSKIPETCVAQYTIQRALNAYQEPDFYKAIATKARANLLTMPPYNAWNQLQGLYIPKFEFANPMFKFALMDISCTSSRHTLKKMTWHKHRNQEFFYATKKRDTKHVRFYVTFECNISQK